MKRAAVPLLALAVTGILVALLWTLFAAPTSVGWFATFNDTSDDGSLPVIEPAAPVAPAPIPIPSEATPATVNYVHDGDTLFINTPGDANLKVRLLAVDTPEVGANLECLGDEATVYLRGLLPEGSTIYTLADVDPYDQYGRALLFVWTSSGELVNLSLVSSGYAEAVFIGDNWMLEAEVEAAEDVARGAGLGIWGGC